MNKRIRSISKDFILGIISSGSVVLVTQFIVYPSIAGYVQQNHFGSILTIMGIVNIISVVLGGSLNNIRLLHNNKYKESEVSGDYSLILLGEIITSVLILSLSFLIGGSSLNVIEKVILFFVLILQLLHSYASVIYRIDLKYIHIFWMQITRSAGYLVGLVGFYKMGFWTVAFLVGELAAFFYVLCTSMILKERPIKTNLFRATLKNLLQLIAANSISNILNYLDRLIIYPMLGAKEVAIYYAASIFGKMAIIIIGPMMGVSLSYLSRTTSMSKKTFRLVLLLAFILGGLTYLIAQFVTPYLIIKFYPSVAEQTIGIIHFTIAAASIGTITTVLTPVILRFCEMRWQVVIQGVFGVLFIGLGILFMTLYGLIGFAIAALISNFVQLSITILVGEIYLYKQESHKIVNQLNLSGGN